MSSRSSSVLCSYVGPTGLVRIGAEQLLDEVDLDESGRDVDDALCHGPSVDVVDVGHEEVEVSGLQASGQLLELTDHLNPTINAAQSLGEVADS